MLLSRNHCSETHNITFHALALSLIFQMQRSRLHYTSNLICYYQLATLTQFAEGCHYPPSHKLHTFQQEKKKLF